MREIWSTKNKTDRKHILTFGAIFIMCTIGFILIIFAVKYSEWLDDGIAGLLLIAVAFLISRLFLRTLNP